MPLSSLFKSHPGKALYTLTSILLTTLRLPIWILYYIPTFTRPHPKWTYKQALLIQIIKTYLNTISTIEKKTPESLHPGREGSNFVVMQPAPSSSYKDAAVSDQEIKPKKIGGTWYPSPPSKSTSIDDLKVILHFHGGAYTIGDGRSGDTKFLAKTLLSNTPATHIFCPQYRLASNSLGRFPSQLQDAITSYNYLTNTLSISPSNITFSGDSAGGHLCLTLLKYISTTPSIPSPKATLLWSPWVSPLESLQPGYLDTAPNAPTDYLSNSFGFWGARSLSPAPSTNLSLSSPELCFLGNNNVFETKTKLWFCVGGAEALFHDVVKSFEGFKERNGGENVELVVQEGAVHDVILTGDLIGFEDAAKEGGRMAGKWLDGL